MTRAPSKPTPGNYRWVICALLFAATTINYIDRQILALLKPILDDQLHWTNEQFGDIQAAFQGAYAVSLLFFGWFIDRFGAKIGYAVSIAAWSLAALSHALVGSIGGFFNARVALGLGEGGNFPAAIKATALWFPKRERALATSIFNSGANVGAIAAPPSSPGSPSPGAGRPPSSRPAPPASSGSPSGFPSSASPESLPISAPTSSPTSKATPTRSTPTPAWPRPPGAPF